MRGAHTQPPGVTLYLDDEMYACRARVVGQPRANASRRRVRIVERWLSPPPAAAAATSAPYASRRPHLFPHRPGRHRAGPDRHHKSASRDFPIDLCCMWTGKQHQTRDHRGRDHRRPAALAERITSATDRPRHLGRKVKRRLTHSRRRRRTSCSLPHRHAIARVTRAISPLEGQDADTTPREVCNIINAEHDGPPDPRPLEMRHAWRRGGSAEAAEEAVDRSGLIQYRETMLAACKTLAAAALCELALCALRTARPGD